MARDVRTCWRVLRARFRLRPRRRRSSDATSTVWHRDVAELTRMATAARSTAHSKVSTRARMSATARKLRGLPAGDVPAWLELDPGEEVLRVATSARFVEIPGWEGLRRAGYGEYAPSRVASSFVREMTEGARVVDAGLVVITDRRVAFLGSCYREDFELSRMVGMAHDPESPCTLLRMSDRTKVSGIVVDEGSAPGFRFDLTLARSDAMGDRWGFAAHLEVLLARHQRLLPAVVGSASPGETGRTHRLDQGGVAALSGILRITDGRLDGSAPRPRHRVSARR